MKFTRKPHKKLPADNLLAGKILYFFNCLLDGEQSLLSNEFNYLTVSFERSMSD